MNPIISTEYLVIIAIGALVATGLASWYTTRKTSFLARIFITICRLAGVSGILFLALNMGHERERFEAVDSSWALMVDNSASMAFEDVSAGSRWEAALAIAQTALDLSEDKEKISIYSFSDTAAQARADELLSLRPDGNATRIVEAGQSMLIREKSRGANLLGVLLLSDGRQPVSRPPDQFALRAAAKGIPIYPIVLGDHVPSQDLALKIPHQKLVSFKGQPITFKGELLNHRLGPVQAEIQLRDADGEVLEKTDVLVNNGEQVPFSFELAPAEPGYYEYVIATPLREGESDRANNSVNMGVFVMAERLNVLLLEGEPYWDTKFLSHLLRAQTNISMTAIFRVAKDKFFKVSTDTDMTSSDTDVFPLTDEELAQYDLVVLGRGTEYFIDAARAERLDEFVKNRGGCLFFARGKSYEGANSQLQALEPVAWGEPIRSDFIMRPLLAGEQVGLFGGLLPDRDQPLWGELPILTRGYEAENLKSFASVLALGVPESSPDAPFPLLISRRHGNGLILMINGDGLWKWGFLPDVDDDGALYQNLWIQLFQWAVSFAEFNPGSDYVIRADQSNTRVNAPLRVRVRARAHVKTENIVVSVYRGDQLVQTMALTGDAMPHDGWNGLVTPATPGIYRLVVETPGGKDLGARTSVRILPLPGETDDFSADSAFLAELARKSGGRIISKEDLPGLIKRLETPKKSLRKGDVVWETWWDKAWVCVLIMLCFSLEWYLRRRRGLH